MFVCLYVCVCKLFIVAVIVIFILFMTCLCIHLCRCLFTGSELTVFDEANSEAMLSGESLVVFIKHTIFHVTETASNSCKLSNLQQNL